MRSAVLDADLASGTLLLEGPSVGLRAVLDLVVLTASGVEAQLASSVPLGKRRRITRRDRSATAAALLDRLVDVADLMLVLQAVLESRPGSMAVADLEVAVIVAAVSVWHATATDGDIASCNGFGLGTPRNALAVAVDDLAMLWANLVALPIATLAVLHDAFVEFLFAFLTFVLSEDEGQGR